MKVLHLPENIASQIQISVTALRKAGLEARGLVRDSRLIQSGESLEDCSLLGREHRRLSAGWFRDRAFGLRHVLSAIQWADVVHYHYGGECALHYNADIEWAVFLRKARFINFWGTDIRVAEKEAADNPYFAEVYPQISKWAGASHERSRRLQEFYARRGFHCVIGSETMIAHIDRGLFPRYHLVRCSIDVRGIGPLYPDPESACPVIVHTPSDTAVKGTSAVLEAVDTLRRKRLDFEFVLIHQQSRQQALDQLRRADIFLDQFVLGGYGMAAIEAMAMGKAVVCYIKPSMTAAYPPDLPVVNTSRDNLVESLECLLTNGALRRSIGERGRRYAETYHDSLTLARQLQQIYSIARNVA